jgi:hypothetical protein
MLYSPSRSTKTMALAFSSSFRRLIVSTTLFLAFVSSIPGLAQTPSAQSQDFHEMLVTAGGFIAIDTPKGWVRGEGPGLAYFVHKGDSRGTALVWIYISSAPVGPEEEAKNVSDYIATDIAGFKQHFKSGSVSKDAPIDLPNMKTRAPVYTFLSGEKANAFEQVIYIAENSRVLILALSAKQKDAFDNSMKEFREFAQSYRGSIIPAEPPSK